MVTNLCWALDNCPELYPELCPKLIFEVELRKAFEDYVSQCMAFNATAEVDAFQPFPSIVEAKLTVFVNCVYALSQHIDFDAMYWCSVVLESVRSLKHVAGENYLIK